MRRIFQGAYRRLSRLLSYTARRQLIGDQLGFDFRFSDGQVVVTHYENLQNQAVVIEGFVDQENLHLPFKAIIDLYDAKESGVYAPLTDDPSTDDLQMLDWINYRIGQLGGDPYVGHPRPTRRVIILTAPGLRIGVQAPFYFSPR